MLHTAVALRVPLLRLPVLHRRRLLQLHHVLLLQMHHLHLRLLPHPLERRAPLDLRVGVKHCDVAVSQDVKVVVRQLSHVW